LFRAPRKDDSLVLPEDIGVVLGLADLGQHLAAAYLGGDEMRVLAAEVDDGDAVVTDVLVHGTVPNGYGRKNGPKGAPEF